MFQSEIAFLIRKYRVNLFVPSLSGGSFEAKSIPTDKNNNKRIQPGLVSITSFNNVSLFFSSQPFATGSLKRFRLIKLHVVGYYLFPRWRDRFGSRAAHTKRTETSAKVNVKRQSCGLNLSRAFKTA